MEQRARRNHGSTTLNVGILDSPNSQLNLGGLSRSGGSELLCYVCITSHSMSVFKPWRASEPNSPAKESPKEGFLLPETRRLQQETPVDRNTQLQTSVYAAWVQDWWLVEIISLLWGTISIIALCIILRRYQDKSAPRLNSIAGVGTMLIRSYLFYRQSAVHLCFSPLPNASINRSGLGLQTLLSL
jgi:hypothetical protein